MPEKTQGTEAQPPNILYIFTDDQSTRSVSCYPEAHPWVHTPNIDRIGEQGMRFTQCYTGAWCAPSRATALTGLLQHSIESLRLVGGYPAFSMDHTSCPAWPSRFRAAGWYTGIIGKWHTGPDHGHGRDWDYSAVWDHTQPEIYGDYYTNQSISFNGAPPKAVGGYSTDNYTQWATEFIRDRAKDTKRPWYLWLCYDAVHLPCTVADRHTHDYPDVRDVPIPADIYPPRPTKASHMRVYGVWRRSQDGRPVDLKKGRLLTDWVLQYNRAVRSLDEGVGRVLAALEETGQLDNTLIVFTSDQGFAWGQHGFQWKYAPYDANLLSPLLVRLPGSVHPGTVCECPVGGQDLVPTFFAHAGISLPWKMHGHDLTPLLRDPEAQWDYPLLVENTWSFFGSDTNGAIGIPENGIPWWVSLRMGKYKYIRWLVPGEIEELYDLDGDPEELRNLALEAEYHALLADCRERTVSELRRTDAGMVDNLPHVTVTTARELLGDE